MKIHIKFKPTISQTLSCILSVDLNRLKMDSFKMSLLFAHDFNDVIAIKKSMTLLNS